MNNHSTEPYGSAIKQCYTQPDVPVSMKVHIKNVATHEVDVHMFFEQPEEFLEIDRIAYQLCRGRILDIGAGVGRFALPLQKQGLTVCAMEELPQAIAIMQERGVQDICSMELDDFLDQSIVNEKFDTVLMIMNGLGIVGTFDKLALFLDKIKPFLKPDGQILADSMSVNLSKVNDFSKHIEIQKMDGKYPGEVQLKFEYQGVLGSDVAWLHIDEIALASLAEKTGWVSDVIYRDDDGTYLTRLTMI